ncbi:hypothetical protein ABZ744_20475 [Micromonospora chersina]|uniref:hypothetical protein n=1 Tax=Micromonospora chersina TaxID=47854 RepID=UPI0034007D72
MTADESPQGPMDGAARPEILARWKSLRDAVVSELRAVGLPAEPAWSGEPESEEPCTGVLVNVNPAADVGGVQITWCQPIERLTRIADSYQAGEPAESMVTRYGRVDEVLTTAAVLVLALAGYGVAPARLPYSTMEYDVLHGPDAI